MLLRLRRKNRPFWRKLKMLQRSRKILPRIHSIHWMAVSMTSYPTDRILLLAIKTRKIPSWTRQRRPEEINKCLLLLTPSWVFITFQNKSIAFIRKMKKTRSLSLPRTMEIIPAFFIHSTRRRENNRSATLQEQSKAFCQE